MTGDLRLAPGVELFIQAGQLIGRFLAQFGNFIGDVRNVSGIRCRKRFKLFDLGVELGNRAFEIEIGPGRV